MPNVLVVLGSARKGRVADKILEHVQAALADRQDIHTTVADLQAIGLPFFDNPTSPSRPDYVSEHESVDSWSKLVSDNDVIIFLTPEYNHALSAIQKNAFDWLYKEWKDKPIIAVAYSWTGGVWSTKALDQLVTQLGGVLAENPAQLVFNKDITPKGMVMDQSALDAKLAAAFATI